MANKQSDNRNMKRLKDEQQVRQRPAPIFGTNDEKGAFHSIDEIISNSVDEAREGYGRLISVTVEQGNVITIEDNGRGLPMDWNEEEQMYNWELALCTLYAYGKYDASQYNQSLGLNGLGLTATQFASSFMDVWSTYDGKTRYMHFEKGKPVGNMQVTNAIREGTGTKITFQPDPEVFPALKRVPISANMFIESLNSKAMLLDGLQIDFTHYDFEKTTTFRYDGGMAEYIDRVGAESKLILPNTAYYFDEEIGNDPESVDDFEDYKVNMRMAFNFCRDTSMCKVYHNSSLMFEQGENKTVDAFEVGITGAFTDFARNNGKIGKNDRFLYKDIESMLLCVATTDAPGNRTWFKNQTKGAINNPFIASAFKQFVYSKVRYWLEHSGTVGERVLAEALINMQARIEGAEVSKKVVRNLKKDIDFKNKPKDFRDASSKNVFERELYIVEGRSALGSVKLACNPKFQGVMPVRGKPINCLKEKITKVLNNDIIIDLYRVLGCGMEVNNKNIEDLPKFDINKLKWGKVIICTDADYDGYHIRTLLITMFYILSPSLLKAGKVYIAETPLYEMTYKGETKFAFDEAEKEKYMEYFKNLGATESKIRIQRSKGLGENDPEMMAVSTMNPDTRRLVPVEYPDDDSELRGYFNALLGDDLEMRRILINEYFDLVEAGE